MTFGCAGPPQAIEATLINNPNENVPLAGILSVSADRPVKVSLRIEDTDNVQEISAEDLFETAHSIPVVGLRPARKHTITPTIEDERGRKTVLEPLEIETPPLPEDFPPIEITHDAEGELEPGFTVLHPFRWTSPFETDDEWGIAIAVDEKGEVVWYMQNEEGIAELRRMYNGNLMYSGHQDGRLYEVDILGNLIREWHTSGALTEEPPEESLPVSTDAFHHDVIQIPSGDFIGLGLEVVSFDDFPLEYPPSTKTGPADIAGDHLIQFDHDGKTVREWSVIDILDPKRLGDGSLGRGFYERIYKEDYEEIPMDITHCNAIYYIEEEDAVIVSSNVQCLIFKVDMSTGELKWILGDPIGWKEPWASKVLKPVGDVIWPCHQHGIEMTPNGRILVFDNGGERKIPPQEAMPIEERFSRAVEYMVDEEAGTVEETWSYGPAQERFVSPFISDADYMPETGNVLITDGGRFIGPDGEPMVTFGGHQWARVLEVSHDENPRKLWEVTVKDPEVRYSIYRAQKWRSLYKHLDIPTG